jgi:neurofibromin 1
MILVLLRLIVSFAKIELTLDIMVPRNSNAFALNLSKYLATSCSHLTLEFCKEWVINFHRSSSTQQTACIQYLEPWLPNLEAYAKPSRDDASETIKQVTEIIRGLIQSTVSESTVSDAFETY